MAAKHLSHTKSKTSLERDTPQVGQVAYSEPQATHLRVKRLVLFVAVLGVVVMLDQLSKHYIRTTLVLGERAPFIPGFIELYHVQNTGAAFSIGQGAGWLFVLIACTLTLGAFALVYKDAALNTPFIVCLGAICGGGIGNVCDRLTQGAVTDFLATTFMSFPVFNVADIFVTVGVAFFLVFSLWQDTRQK